MKKKLSFICSVFFTLVFSQTTITKAFNDPIVGDIINNNVVTGTIDNSATGSGATFSNPGITMGATATNTYTVPSTTEISTYPGSTIKHNDGTGNAILYKSSATKIEITAILNTNASLNFAADNATTITYPTSFGNSFTDTARGTFSSGAMSGLFKGNTTTTADATGTLIIGSKIYPNILRLKIAQIYNLYQSIDTSYFSPIGTVTSTIYTYFDNLNKFPLLTYTEGNISVPLFNINQSTSGAQAQNFVFLGVNDVAKSKFRIYPNPVQDVLRFEGIKDYTTASIYAADGRLVKEILLKENFINISELQKGNYVLKLNSKEKKPQSFLFIKQ